MEKIRSFIAVEISDNARSEITRILNKFSQEDTGARWVKQDNLHITLLFLGEVSEGFITKAEKELTIIAQSQKQFEMSFKNIGAFPSLHSPRIIWIGVGQGADELIDLQGKIESAFTKIGYEPEARKFHPHLTIGRVKFRFNNPQIFETHYQSEVFGVKSVVLFKSTLMPQGSIYEKIKEFPLTTNSTN
jgi:2'-5' RNA ligase